MFTKHGATKQPSYITLWSHICVSKVIIGQQCNETAEKKKNNPIKHPDISLNIKIQIIKHTSTLDMTKALFKF